MGLIDAKTGEVTNLVGDRYEILGFVGSGGMGTVYRARDRKLDEIVALKVLRHDLAFDPGALARFRREVKLARRVTHRNVARTFDLGEHGQISFLTMELVQGESLASRLVRKGRLAVDVAVRTAIEIAAGLEAAHGAGVVHRDLKPDNVLVSDGRVVVTDFGIALADGSPSDSRIVGTLPYLAPEQLEGLDPLDARVDLYALGLVLYEMLTGELPWTAGSDLGLAMARLGKEPRDPREVCPDVPADLARVVLRALARRPEDRIPTATAFIEELRAVPLPSGPLPGESSPTVAPPRPSDKTVAVLRLAYAGDAEGDYVGAGLTEALIDELANAGARVRASPAAFAMRDPREAGHELGVDAVLTGAVELASERLRVALRLVSVADGFVIWTSRFDGARADAYAFAARAAWQLAGVLSGRLPETVPSLPDGEATDLYLRGRRTYHRFWRTSEAISLLEKAAAAAPNDGRILAALALALCRETGTEVDTAKARTAAEDHAARALALAPELAEAHVAVGVVCLRDGDVVEAAGHVRRALDVSPGQVDAIEHAARILLETSAVEEGIAHAQLAMRVEPLLGVSLPYHVARGLALLGEWDAVDAVFRDVPEENAARATYWLTRARLAIWRDSSDEARRVVAELESDSFPHKAFPLALAHVRIAARLGPFERQFVADRARSRTSSMRQRCFFAQIATELLAHLGEHDEALASLEAASLDGLFDQAWLEGCPALGPLRGDPRFVRVALDVSDRSRRAVGALLAPPQP